MIDIHLSFGSNRPLRFRKEITMATVAAMISAKATTVAAAPPTMMAREWSVLALAGEGPTASVEYKDDVKEAVYFHFVRQIN